MNGYEHNVGGMARALQGARAELDAARSQEASYGGPASEARVALAEIELREAELAYQAAERLLTDRRP